MSKKGLDIAKLAERLAQLDKNDNRESSGMSFLNIKDGRNVLRVLPAREGADVFYEEAWVHYGVGKSKDNKNGTMIVCPTTHNENAKCPVCELSSELKKLSSKKDDSYDKQARSIYRKKRVYYNAISRDESSHGSPRPFLSQARCHMKENNAQRISPKDDDADDASSVSTSAR